MSRCLIIHGATLNEQQRTADNYSPAGFSWFDFDFYLFLCAGLSTGVIAAIVIVVLVIIVLVVAIVIVGIVWWRRKSGEKCM